MAGNWVLEAWNITSLAGKEAELVQGVERYQLNIAGLTSTHCSGSGFRLLQRGWTPELSPVRGTGRMWGYSQVPNVLEFSLTLSERNASI